MAMADGVQKNGADVWKGTQRNTVSGVARRKRRGSNHVLVREIRQLIHRDRERSGWRCGWARNESSGSRSVDRKILGGPDVEVCLGLWTGGAGLGAGACSRWRGRKFKDMVGGRRKSLQERVREGHDHSSWGKSDPEGPLMAPRE